MQQSLGRGERSVRRRYLAALGILLVGLLGLVVLMTIWTYRDVRRQVESELEGRLLSIGSVVAQRLLSTPITAASPADSAAQFLSIRDELRRIAAASNLGVIQVVDDRRRHLVGTLETTRFGERDPFLDAQPEVAVALAGIPAATPLYEASEIRGTFFKTGFVPIESDDGAILGLVAVEGGSGFFEILPSLRRTWRLVGLASAIIAVLLALLLISVFRALERYERGLRGAAALATAGQLASVVAHEIRNPLAVLQSRAERIQEEVGAGGDAREIARLLEVIPQEVRRLDRILSNYLSLARVREGGGSCAVLPVVADTLELVEKDLSQAQIRSTIDAASREIRARIDAGALRQALMNLFLNARDAMTEGGELHVRVRREGRWVRIEVEDSGEGIDKKVMRRLFEPFFTTRPTGSGLGLAVVESVVGSAAGRVEVASEPGRGSSFTLWLPVDEKGELHGHTAESVSDPARRG
jgi:signal transduction histidine kinase